MAKKTDDDLTIILVILALVVMAGLGGGKLALGGGGSQGATGTASSLANGANLSPGIEESRLAVLPVSSETSMAGYSRALFPTWEKATTHGWSGVPDACDSREAALIRDGKDVKYGKSCSITSGTWIDPYTGTKTTISRDMDIDHLVPLAAAWRSGASRWTTAQREKYANDPLVLVTAGASANRSKGDKGPDQWTPPAANAQCAYAMRWIEIKATYQLTATAPEKAKLTSMLATCPTSTPTPSPSPAKKA